MGVILGITHVTFLDSISLSGPDNPSRIGCSNSENIYENVSQVKIVWGVKSSHFNNLGDFLLKYNKVVYCRCNNYVAK